MSIKLIQLDFPEVVLIPCIGDGSCFFHACLTATSEPYKKLNSKDKMEQALEFRKYLARILEHEINGKLVYHKLSRGGLHEFSKVVPEFSLENMKKELNSTDHVDNKYNELVSNTLNVDIYIIESETQDILITGNDPEILYHNRSSIVILYSPGHYDLIGYKKDDKKHTIFSADHEFIQTLRKRIDILIEIGKKRQAEEKKAREEKKAKEEKKLKAEKTSK